MSAIMAQMTPEAAERLTVELAARSGSDRGLNPSNLPKIEGRPAGGIPHLPQRERELPAASVLTVNAALNALV